MSVTGYVKPLLDSSLVALFVLLTVCIGFVCPDAGYSALTG
jgi:hypothetical protein